MIIKIHRGTHQIGGCITEIKTNNARIFIDIGEELPNAAKFTELDIDGVTSGEVDCGGIFITHYHGDHVGLYSKVFAEIPIYMGEVSKEIYLALMTRIHADDIERIEAFNTFKALDKIVIGDIVVTPLLVDHSAFDAYMFLIESEGKRILHTGDFRLHGFRGKAVIPTLEKYVGEIDVLITEGTSLSRENTNIIEERELQMSAKRILKDNKYVFVLCSSTNIDRIAAFYNATPRGKYFVCDDYQKGILDIVTKHAGDKTSLYNFQKVITYGENLDEKLRERGFCMIIRSTDYFRRLIDKFPEAAFVYSMWEGYKLDKANNKGVVMMTLQYDFQSLHTSGHASREQIIKVCDTVKPRVGIVPIHSDAPEVIYELGVGYLVLVLEDGVEVEV